MQAESKHPAKLEEITFVFILSLQRFQTQLAQEIVLEETLGVPHGLEAPNVGAGFVQIHF